MGKPRHFIFMCVSYILKPAYIRNDMFSNTETKITWHFKSQACNIVAQSCLIYRNNPIFPVVQSHAGWQMTGTDHHPDGKDCCSSPKSLAVHKKLIIGMQDALKGMRMGISNSYNSQFLFICFKKKRNQTLSKLNGCFAFVSICLRSLSDLNIDYKAQLPRLDFRMKNSKTRQAVAKSAFVTGIYLCAADLVKLYCFVLISFYWISLLFWCVWGGLNQSLLPYWELPLPLEYTEELFSL